jgi:hypothetical protein
MLADRGADHFAVSLHMDYLAVVGVADRAVIGIKKPSPPKVPHRARIKALQQVFAERWPLAFDKTQVSPLQIGVGAEIEAALKGEVPRRLVRQAIS